MAKGIFDATHFFSDSDGLRLTQNFLGEEEDHANLSEITQAAHNSNHDLTWVNAIGSLAASVLYQRHPIKKEYKGWQMRSLDLIRGGLKDGTRLTQLDAIGEQELTEDLATLSFVYLSLVGKTTAKYHDKQPALAGITDESTQRPDEVITPGEAFFIADWPIEHTIDIQPDSVVVRMSYL